MLNRPTICLGVFASLTVITPRCGGIDFEAAQQLQWGHLRQGTCTLQQLPPMGERWSCRPPGRWRRGRIQRPADVSCMPVATSRAACPPPAITAGRSSDRGMADADNAGSSTPHLLPNLVRQGVQHIGWQAADQAVRSRPWTWCRT
jgi:hypothetical protein